ncbi:MAG: NifB/NifX family molybdenum-iron cluster-binding protein, partial [Oscillospiraceae bacterium]|nr:NifB/NifX family molybdenum-iron cluster-binding protein [Oscillospiraceae bacterium]
MKLAVPYKDGEVFQHFGHSEAFRIYTIEDGAIVATATINTEGVGHEALAQLLRGQGVETVIAGGIGDGAERALTAEGIDLCSGVSGPADAIVEAYIASTLEYGSGANCSHHHDHDDDEEGGCGGGC